MLLKSYRVNKLNKNTERSKIFIIKVASTTHNICEAYKLYFRYSCLINSFIIFKNFHLKTSYLSFEVVAFTNFLMFFSTKIHYRT